MPDESALNVIKMAPTKEEAQRLIEVVMETTRNFTREWVKSYDDLDDLFLQRAFDIGGFQCYQFVEHGLKKHGIDDINKIGAIFEELDKQRATYLEKYPRGKRQKRRLLDQERNLPTDIFRFIADLETGKGGVYGEKYREAIADFLGYKNEGGRKIRKGPMMWKIIWAYCWNCRYLRKNYRSSFKKMVREKAEEWLRNNGYDDEAIEAFPDLDLDKKKWENLVSHLTSTIKSELKFIGKELAPYLLRDVREFKMAGDLIFKLDIINIDFVMKSGLIFLPCKEATKTLEELRDKWNNWRTRKQLYAEIINLANPSDYPISFINRNIYAYATRQHVKNGFGYCQNEDDCKRCNARHFCLSGRVGMKHVLKNLKELGFGNIT